MFDPYGMFSIGQGLSDGASFAGLGSIPASAGAGGGILSQLGGFMGSPITAGLGAAAGGYMMYQQHKDQKEAEKQRMKEAEKQRNAQQQYQNLMALMTIANYWNQQSPSTSGR